MTTHTWAIFTDARPRQPRTWVCTRCSARIRHAGATPDADARAQWWASDGIRAVLEVGDGVPGCFHTRTQTRSRY